MTDIVSLSDISEIVDCPHSTPKWTASGVPVIRNYNLNAGVIDQNDLSYTDEEGYKSRIKRAIPEGGDIVLSREAPMGTVGIVPDGFKCCLGQRLVLIKPNRQVCIPHYLNYAMQSQFVQNQIQVYNSSGTTVSNLKIPVIESIQIPLPSLDVQQNIVDTIKPFDDLIEIKKKINDYLSYLSQHIFHEWLFNRNVSECVSLTDKPGCQPISELCTTITDGSHYSPPSDVGTHAIFSVKDMRTNSFDRKGCKLISNESFEKLRKEGCVPEIDDILIAKDGSYLKEVFIVNDPMNDAVLSSIAIFRPDKTKIHPLILLHYFREPEIVSCVKDNCVSGSAIPRIVLKSFKQIRLLVPPIDEQQSIIPSLVAIHKQIINNEKTNERLTLLRESLLSRLVGTSR